MPGPLCLAPTPSGEGSSSGGCTSPGFLPGQPLLPHYERENWEQEDEQRAMKIPAGTDVPAVYFCVCDAFLSHAHKNEESQCRQGSGPSGLEMQSEIDLGSRGRQRADLGQLERGRKQPLWLLDGEVHWCKACRLPNEAKARRSHQHSNAQRPVATIRVRIGIGTGCAALTHLAPPCTPQPLEMRK